MYVTEIKKLDSKKSLVILEDASAFALYKSELKKYEINEEKELDEKVYEEILWSVLRKRGIERAGYILGKSDKSEYDLRNKLRQGYYPEVIIDEIVKYYSEYGYINDIRYTENYVKYNILTKSKKRIYSELVCKGIDKEIISNVLEKYDDENIEYKAAQNQLILKTFKNKKYDFDQEDFVLLNKIIASLMRKGFGYDDIMQAYHGFKNGENV